MLRVSALFVLVSVCLPAWFFSGLALTVGPLGDSGTTLPAGNAVHDYRIAVGDRLSMTVAGVPEYTGPLIVQANGTVRLLDYGDVPVAGLSLAEAQRRITQRLVQAQLLTEPAITLGLSEVSPRRVTVLGRVARPGSYLLTPTAIAKLPRLTESLQQAGGILDSADVRRVEVRRVQPESSPQTLSTDLTRLLLEGDLNQNPVLQDGDVVTIPELAQADSVLMNQVAAANFASGEIQVGLVGAVAAPGVVKLPPGTSLNEALLKAGGLLPQGDSNITLVRYGPTGQVEQQQLRIDWAARPGTADNPALRSRDFILVGRNFGAQVSDLFGQILSPLNGALGLFNIYTLLAAPKP